MRIEGHGSTPRWWHGHGVEPCPSILDPQRPQNSYARSPRIPANVTIESMSAHSTTACAPSPDGPKIAVGMPAAPSSAESIQPAEPLKTVSRSVASTISWLSVVTSSQSRSIPTRRGSTPCPVLPGTARPARQVAPGCGAARPRWQQATLRGWCGVRSPARTPLDTTTAPAHRE